MAKLYYDKDIDDQILRNPYICPIPDGVLPPISKD